MTPKAFKAHFKTLMKLNEDFNAKYKLTIGDIEMNLIFQFPSYKH